MMLGPPGAGKGTQARQLRRRWDIPHISTGAMLREAVQAGTPLGREVAAIMESGGLINDEVITRVVTERLEQPDTRNGFLLDGFPRTIPQAQALDQMVGGLARRLELPANAWTRRYRARVHGEVDPERLAALARGITIEGVRYGAIEARLDRQQRTNAWIDIALTEAEVVRRLASRMVCAECGTNATGEGDRCHDCGGPLVPRADDREQVVINRLKVYREQTEPLVRYYGGRPTYCRIDGARLPDDVTADIFRAVEEAARR